MNGNHQKSQTRPNGKSQKVNQQADYEQSAILHGIDKLSELFKKEMVSLSYNDI